MDIVCAFVKHLMNKQPLFRNEVVRSQTEWLASDVILARPVALWVITVGGFAFACLIVSFLMIGHFTKRASAMGILQPSQGAIRLIPPGSVTIIESRVKDGQSVQKGDVLFIVGDERTFTTNGASASIGATIQGHLQRKQEELLQARLGEQAAMRQTLDGLISKIEKIKTQLTLTRQEIDLAKARVASAEQTLHRDQLLAKEHFLSDQAVQQKEDQLVDAKAQLASIQRGEAALETDLSIAEHDIKITQTKEAIRLSEIEREMASIEQESSENHAKYRYEVTAPRSGTVTAILGAVGQTMSNQAIATLLPRDSGLEAQLFVPSRAVGFVEASQKVKLRYQAYPYQKFGQYEGVVASIARSQIEPNELPSALPFPVSQGKEGLYRISVVLKEQSVNVYGKPTPLVAGMVVDADIEQDTRLIIEWLLEPIYALKGKLV